MRMRRIGLLATGLLLVAGIAAGCGSDDNKDQTPTKVAGTTPAASSTAAGAVVKATITAKDFSFTSNQDHTCFD